MDKSGGPFSTFATVVLLVAEATVAAKICRNLSASHPVVTLAAVILFVAKTAVSAQPSRNLVVPHPVVTLATVVLLTSEATVVAEICRIIGHDTIKLQIRALSNYYKSIELF